jgi:hypothetical protein
VGVARVLIANQNPAGVTARIVLANGIRCQGNQSSSVKLSNVMCGHVLMILDEFD